MDSFSYSLSSADVVQHPRALYHALQLRLTDNTSDDQEVNPPFNRSCHFLVSQDCVLSRRKARVCVFGVLWLLGINLSVSDFGRIVSCLYRGDGTAEVGVFFVVANVLRSGKDVGGDERDSDHERMIFDAPIPNMTSVSCPICLDGFKGAGLISNVIRTQCNHVFHRQCLQKWISTKKGTPNCPNCRAVLV